MEDRRGLRMSLESLKSMRYDENIMNNDIKIKPLLKYDVTYYDGVIGPAIDSFTADDHYTNDVGVTTFLRTGNIIREYILPIIKVVITPVDDDEH